MALFGKKKQAHRVENLKIGTEMNFSSAEAYNLLRTNLYFSLPQTDGRGKIIGITSASPQEGKSYTSINLAYTFAKDGKKVLLIDGDMRKPSLGRKLKRKNSPGFSNLLVDSSAEVINRDVLIENLDVIFSGDVPPNPSELLGSERLKQIMEEFRLIYDYIVIDLPPVNVVSDALVISSVMDGIAIAVRHGWTSKKEITESIGRLKFANVHILGYIYRGYSHKLHYYKKNGSYSHYKYYYYGTNDKK